MTDEHILAELRKTNKEASQKDVASFRRFMHCFDCEDAETYAEAKEKILASMDMIREEVDLADSNEQALAIVHQRYARL